MSAEEISNNLEEAKNRAEQSQDDINKFINTLNEHALKLISEIYENDLLTMESNGFKEILNSLSVHLTPLGIDIDNVIFGNQLQ